MVHLNNIWFVIIAIFWVGFFVLEGFDFGVGMLHSFVGKNDVERRIAVNSIGPIWDGNEVWLIVGGAAIFAAFPSWYATMFSTFYLVTCGRSPRLDRARGFIRVPPQDRQPTVAGDLEMVAHTGERPHPLAARHCSWAISCMGCPSIRRTTTQGASSGCWCPTASTRGSPLTVLSLFLGATYLTLKTEGALHERVARLSSRLGWVAAAITFGWLTWSHVGLGTGFVPNPIDALALIAVVGAAWLAESGSQGWAFAAAATAIGSVVGSIFFELFPRVMVSSTNAAYNLTVANSASPSYTLKVMTVVAVIFFPVVLLYQGWSLYVFRKRLKGRGRRQMLLSLRGLMRRPRRRITRSR